jgi:hypothetical protein
LTVGRTSRWRTWVRDPLARFLVLGVVIFLSYQWVGSGAVGSGRIVVSAGRIEALAAGFARARQRPPTPEEMDALIVDYLREEMATREAMALGLDRDDTLVRRRLRQKLEFLAEDATSEAEPTEEEFAKWLADHPDHYRVEDRVAFRHVYLSRERRGSSLEVDASRLLAELSVFDGATSAPALGDPILLPSEFPLSSRSTIARELGRDFADGVFALEAGRWHGPIDSAFGAHLVFVRERQEGHVPALADVRDTVERDVNSARRRQRIDRMYERLAQRYDVVVERGRDEDEVARRSPDVGGLER